MGNLRGGVVVVAMVCVVRSQDLVARPLVLERSGDKVVVVIGRSSSGGFFPHDERGTVVALYAPAGCDISRRAPTRLALLTAGTKNVTTYVPNLRSSLDFVLYTSFDDVATAASRALGRSNAIGFRDPNEARAFRVLPATGGFWKIAWSSRGAVSSSFGADDADADDDEMLCVNFCELSGGRGRVRASTTRRRAYERSELCGSPVGGFRDPGAVHEVVFACQNDEDVEYACGCGTDAALSEPRIFRCPAEAAAEDDDDDDDEREDEEASSSEEEDSDSDSGGSSSFFSSSSSSSEERRTRFVVFGNLGRGTRLDDDSVTFPESFPGVASRMTTGLVAELAAKAADESSSSSSSSRKRLDFVLHVGNLAYADGYVSAWDEYLEQIEAFASTVAYVPLFGAAEFAGGECGVPAARLFPRPTPWTSVDVGLVRVVGLCTELDLRPDSEQWRFLEKALRDVDRRKTPWLVVAGEDSQLRRHVEPLLLRYDVDLCFWGRDAVYQRPCFSSAEEKGCGVLRETFHPTAPVHFVLGTGGATLHNTQRNALRELAKWGVGHVDAHNATHLDVEFLDNGANGDASSPGKVLDFVTIVKENFPFHRHRRRPSSQRHTEQQSEEPSSHAASSSSSSTPAPPPYAPDVDSVVLLIAAPLLLWVAYDSAMRTQWWADSGHTTVHDDDDVEDHDEDVHHVDDTDSEVDYHSYLVSRGSLSYS